MKTIFLIICTLVLWATSISLIKIKYKKLFLKECAKNIMLINENTKYKSIINDLTTLPEEHVVKENLSIIKHFKN